MAFTEIDEKLLVRAYQAGDERAFDTIVRTQYNALYAHALRRLSSHEAAEDAVQDTLLRAYRALANLDGDLALKAWLHRILTNVCHDEGNRRRRQQGLVDKIGALPEEVETDPADEAVLFDTVRVMAEALKDLPESYREALVLRYVDGLSFREVAEATGVTEENARARVHRGKSALHKIMSRVAIMVAFIVPGLKRTQQATPTGTEQTAIVGAPDHAFNLTTQLTSHVVNASPAISRFAEISTAMPGGKSGLAAAAMTAVVAVAAPVAYTVNEVRKPERVPAAVAAPAPAPASAPAGTTTTDATPTVGPLPAGSAGGAAPGTGAAPSTTSTSTSTSSTLPPSLARPFEGEPTVSTTVPKKPDAAASTTTTSTPPTSQPPRTEGRVVEGRIGSAALTVAGAPPQFDIEADVVVTVGADSQPGTLGGRLYLYDDGTAVSDTLRLVVDGRTLNLRWRGTHVRTDDDGVVRYEVTGDYSLRDAATIGLAEAGQILAVLRLPAEGEGSVTLDLRGRERS